MSGPSLTVINRKEASQMIIRIALPSLLVALAVGSTAAANSIDAQSGRIVASDGTSYWRELDVNVEGAHNVQHKIYGEDAWEDFGYDEQGGTWFIEAEGFTTAADMSNETSGPLVLRVQMPTGNAIYTFDINEVHESSFPAAPQVSPIPAIVPQDHTYQWTWGGGMADGLGVGLGFETGESYEDDSLEGTMNVDDLSWQPDVATTGAAVFRVGYGIATTWQITDWTFSADSTTADVFDFSGADYRRELIISEHEVAGFRVVPEPATAVLLGCGCAVLWRRRRERSGHRARIWQSGDRQTVPEGEHQNGAPQKQCHRQSHALDV
jgi:hypothetical protein